jgi:hypothetical protein
MGDEGAMTPSVIEGNHGHSLQLRIWRAEWELRDWALELVTTQPHLVRDVAAQMDTSHRNIVRWSEQARAIPPEDRDPFHSTRHAIAWARKEGRYPATEP